MDPLRASAPVLGTVTVTIRGSGDRHCDHVGPSYPIALGGRVSVTVPRTLTKRPARTSPVASSMQAIRVRRGPPPPARQPSRWRSSPRRGRWARGGWDRAVRAPGRAPRPGRAHPVAQGLGRVGATVLSGPMSGRPRRPRSPDNAGAAPGRNQAPDRAERPREPLRAACVWRNCHPAPCWTTSGRSTSRGLIVMPPRSRPP